MSRDTNLLDQIAEVREHTDRQHTHTHTHTNQSTVSTTSTTSTTYLQHLQLDKALLSTAVSYRNRTRRRHI